MVEFDRSAFIGKFQVEAAEYLQRLNEGVIMLEADAGNEELIDQMLRDAHTLKGSSRMVGLLEISDVAHRLEDVMVKIRDRDYAYTAYMSDLFFEALDMIVYLADNAQSESGTDADIEGLCTRLSKLADATDDGSAAASIGVEEKPAPKGKRAAAAKK